MILKSKFDINYYLDNCNNYYEKLLIQLKYKKFFIYLLIYISIKLKIPDFSN